MTDQNADLCAVQLDAREELDIRPATNYRSIDITVIRRLLNAALATVLVDVLRYRSHHFMANAMHLPVAAKEFMINADAQQRHADQLAERIVQLGGTPEYPVVLSTPSNHAGYVSRESLSSMLREDIAAAGVLINSYRGIIETFGKNDPTTRHMLEGLMAMDGDHVEEFSKFLLSHFHASAWMLETHRLTLPNLEVVPQPAQAQEEGPPGESRSIHC